MIALIVISCIIGYILLGLFNIWLMVLGRKRLGWLKSSYDFEFILPFAVLLSPIFTVCIGALWGYSRFLDWVEERVGVTR